MSSAVPSTVLAWISIRRPSGVNFTALAAALPRATSADLNYEGIVAVVRRPRNADKKREVVTALAIRTTAQGSLIA